MISWVFREQPNSNPKINSKLLKIKISSFIQEEISFADISRSRPQTSQSEISPAPERWKSNFRPEDFPTLQNQVNSHNSTLPNSQNLGLIIIKLKEI